MRTTLFAAATMVFTLAVGSSWAGTTAGQSCVTVGSGYQRVAATVERPEDCCNGRLQCSQFLSTTRVVRPAHDQRT